MRLIDADVLVEEIKDSFPTGEARGVFLAFVDTQPTVYDVEKVVKQLEGMFNVDPMYYGEEAAWVVDKAINIVREGV